MSKWQSQPLRKFYGILVMTLQYFIPLLVMLVSYTSMFFTIMRRKSANNQNEERDNRIKKNIIKTLALVSLAFIICVSPNQIFYFLSNIGVDVGSYSSTELDITVYMMFSNCMVNPICYALQYEQFREQAKVLFCRKGIVNKDECKRKDNNACSSKISSDSSVTITALST